MTSLTFTTGTKMTTARNVLFISILLLLSCAAFAETGKITRVENETYAQSKHISKNREVYWIKSQATTYKVTPHNHSDRASLRVGQDVQFRVERKNGKHGVIGKMLLSAGRKKSEYEIIGEAAE